MKHIAIVKLDEAGESACPKRLDQPYDGCIGRRCMAWRWFETHIKTADGKGTELDGTTYGFCGLAGEPG